MAQSHTLGKPYSDVTPLKDVHEVLERQGFAIIAEHRLSESFCLEAKNDVWQALEDLEGAKIRRDDPATYDNFLQLHPENSMLLNHIPIGQLPVVWEAREAAAPIFAHLWGVEVYGLVTSMDAISFNIAPEKFPGGPKGHFQGLDRVDAGWHTDQALVKNGGQCIQGFYNLEHCGPNDSCLSVLEGSHKFHADLRPKFFPTASDRDYNVAEDWHVLDQRELKYLTEEKGCQWRFVCPPKGSFVIWDSRTIHMGTQARLPRDEARDRLVFYVCMFPKAAANHKGFRCGGISEVDINKRVTAFDYHLLTTHWPYPVSTCRTQRQPKMRTMNVSDMTPLQKSLLGV